jgi:Arc/MetJ family transcription regulator
MRTNIDIDNELLSAAMQATGQSTKRATVEEALRRLVTAHRRENALKDMVGIPWVGDLEEMRSGR